MGVLLRRKSEYLASGKSTWEWKSNDSCSVGRLGTAYIHILGKLSYLFCRAYPWCLGQEDTASYAAWQCLPFAGHTRHYISVKSTLEVAEANTKKGLRQHHLLYQPAAVMGPGPKAFVETVQQGQWLLPGKEAAKQMEKHRLRLKM